MNYTGRVGPCKHGIGKVVCDAVKDGGRRAVSEFPTQLIHCEPVTATTSSWRSKIALFAAATYPQHRVDILLG